VSGCGLDSSDSRQDSVTGSCEQDNKLSGSVTGGKFLDSLSDN
jgi:hypothetical protein